MAGADEPAPAPTAPPRPQLPAVPAVPPSTRSWDGGGPRRPSRRTGGRLGREAIGIAVLVVLALVRAGLVTAVVLETQADAAKAARESADYPSAANDSDADRDRALGRDQRRRGGHDRRFGRPREPAVAMAAPFEPVRHGDHAGRGGSGYATKPASGSTFVEQAAQVPADADVVVFFEGAADATVSSLSVASAATNAIAAVRERAPDAKVLLIDPVIDGGVSTTDLTAVQDGLSGAASIARATWVDPIRSRWLP